MTESATREERMREELKEARNKWQEAIANRESLAAEVGNASTPLLRQITSLQESLRVKTDVWQKVNTNHFKKILIIIIILLMMMLSFL